MAACPTTTTDAPVSSVLPESLNARSRAFSPAGDTSWTLLESAAARERVLSAGRPSLPCSLRAATTIPLAAGLMASMLAAPTAVIAMTTASRPMVMVLVMIVILSVPPRGFGLLSVACPHQCRAASPGRRKSAIADRFRLTSQGAPRRVAPCDAGRFRAPPCSLICLTMAQAG